MAERFNIKAFNSLMKSAFNHQSATGRNGNMDRTNAVKVLDMQGRAKVIYDLLKDRLDTLLNPALAADNAADLTKKGIEVLNLNQLNFMDPNLPKIAKEAADGKSGIVNYKFGAHTKFVAYAPIKFNAANLPAPAGFQ